MDVIADSNRLRESIAIWQHALKTDSLSQAERDMFALLRPAFGDEQRNGRKKIQEHELDANVFEPVASNKEAHSVGAP